MKSRFLSLIWMVFYTQIAFSQVNQNLWLPHFTNYIQQQEIPADYNGWTVTHAHQSRTSKLYHVYLRQKLNDIEVVDGSFSIHLDANAQLIKIHDQFVQNLSAKKKEISTILAVEDIIEPVWSEMGYTDLPAWEVTEIKNTPEKFTTIETTSLFSGDVTASLKYILQDSFNLVLSWEIRFESIDGQFAWVVYADAETSAIIKSYNQVLQCHFELPEENQSPKLFFPPASLPVTAQYLYNVFPLKKESPIHGGRQIVVNPADITASPYNWHDTNGAPGPEFTTTKGNNADAREDIDGNNNTLGEMAEGGEDLIFDFPWSPDVHPHINQNASITNLFYWNNIIHDIIYHYGFDEPSGNFQTNNYGNGGLANDHVNAQAMDGGGTNNANFFTPVDGQQPRMQMYLWTGAKSLTVQQPAPIAGNYVFEKAAFGAETFNITGSVILVDDGSSSPTLGCNPLVNGSQIQGNIALVDRGTCEFGVKCLNAQNAGAIAVIICNNVTGNPIVMPPGAQGGNVTIPSIMMRRQDCDLIKVHLSSGVQISMIVGPPVDGDYDNGIICHEYGHGISIRLTGGAGVNNCLNNTEQMGEGWSDWFGLMLTMEEDDPESRARGIGTYALNQPVTGQGIRAYRYSTDMTINPHTYNAIITAAAPHGVGSVWCAMLWELTWALIREYGYDTDLYQGTGGNNIAMALVTEALKLQPCSPGFVDGRDAILLADQLLYNGANQCLIWKSFAKRGLGFSASQGSSTSKTDGTQAFDMPASCCTYVSNTADSGNGSLREAISCATLGDTIRFLNFIQNDTIKLTSATLNINKELTILQPPGWNLVIQSTGNYPVFQNQHTLILENLKLRAGIGQGIRGLSNTGDLTLTNFDIHDPLLHSGSGETILNQGNMFMNGFFIVRDY